MSEADPGGQDAQQADRFDRWLERRARQADSAVSVDSVESADLAPAIEAEPVEEPVSEPVEGPIEEPAAAEPGWQARFRQAVDRDEASAPVEESEPHQPPEPEHTSPAVTRTTPLTSMPDVHEFAPRRGARILVTVVLAAGILATAYVAYRAYQQPSQSTVALAALVAFVTAIVWAVRETTAVTKLAVRTGRLEVVRAGSRFEVDLTGPTTPIELVGTPGDRGWKALIVRRDQPPFEVTSSMVDAEEFTRVVRFYRPGETWPSQDS